MVHAGKTSGHIQYSTVYQSLDSGAPSCIGM